MNTPASPDFDGALEEFDRFCRFIDGMHMGGFVENDFMCKPVQQKIRTALQACRVEVVTVEWKHIDEWHEDIGDCFWTKFPIVEPYFSGSPLQDRFPKYLTHFIPMNIIGVNGLKIVKENV